MTEFEKRVYGIVRRIPRGKVSTYKLVARVIGKPGSARAVGNALNKNRDPKVPCHRVIRSDGFAGGFAFGALKKEAILRKEGIPLKNGRVPPEYIKKPAV